MNKKTENKAVSPLAMGAFSILCPRYSLRRRHERCSHSIQTHGHVEYRYRPLYQWFESSLGDKAIVEPFGRSAENQTLVDRSHANPGRCRIGRNRLDDPRPLAFRYCLAFMWLLAFSSATHDIAADGFYMLGLNEKNKLISSVSAILFIVLRLFSARVYW